MVGFLVVRFHLIRIQDHQVVGANVHTRGFVPALATIAFFSDHETRHDPSLPVRVNATRKAICGPVAIRVTFRAMPIIALD
ncbi:uncharacterized protein Dvar_70630 [Desulfosarcina variabilis str. Montpellier]